ncbi:hypothetical protein [Brevibacterium gallinarum]|uniref:Uncharacterized protein n=1 Tax=Brevibacterium gallinarum TaxID=2762220 RepID=A0ABR8WVG9_9MICO|nr:hypothetical protein [Brevibacterium gallinarum]MBD8020726.1 hypothetical protein [Brevibacterium gallinarum]
MRGWVTCDSLTELWDEDLVDDRPVGAVRPGFMLTLQEGLLAAFGYRGARSRASTASGSVPR